MILAGAILFIIACLISIATTWLARRWALKLGLMDAPGERKVHAIPTPRNGGIGIFWGFALPLLAVITLLPFYYDFANIDGAMDQRAMHLHDAAALSGPHSINDMIAIYVPGLKAHTPLLITFLVATLLIHILGLFDDAMNLKAWIKLIAQIAIAAALVLGGEFLDPLKGGAFRILTSLGFFPSAVISILWIVALTNAFNFLDNMDGLSAGVAFICAGMFLIAALFNQQWFICALLILFMGSVLGFLFFNFPPASIFMGDGGSMLLGFILSVLTIRTTYYNTSSNWYAVLMPLFVMAVPLYDLTIVSVLRLAKGRSPMVGDTNHFSHRLTRHGFSKRGAVLVIYAVTLATGVTAPLLARVDDTSAILLAVQLAGMLVVIGILERVGEHTK